MPQCEILTVALPDRHGNVVQAVEMAVTAFKAVHGVIRARINKTSANGFIMSLADSTHGHQNGLEPGALFSLGGVQFFQYDEVPVIDNLGMRVLCELECIEHQEAPVANKRGRKPKIQKMMDDAPEATEKVVSRAIAPLIDRQ